MSLHLFENFALTILANCWLATDNDSNVFIDERQFVEVPSGFISLPGQIALTDSINTPNASPKRCLTCDTFQSIKNVESATEFTAVVMTAVASAVA